MCSNHTLILGLVGLILYIPVNSYGYVETISSLNHTFFLGKLDYRLTIRSNMVFIWYTLTQICGGVYDSLSCSTGPFHIIMSKIKCRLRSASTVCHYIQLYDKVYILQEMAFITSTHKSIPMFGFLIKASLN